MALSPRQLDKTTSIQKGDTIYNPQENVYYIVDTYLTNIDYNTEVAELIPQQPFGISKHYFSISIDDMINLGYKIMK